MVVLGFSRIIPTRKSSSAAGILKNFQHDPSFLQDLDGTWYAFATASGVHNIQAASAPSTGRNSWASDVRRVGAGQYIVYYSGEVAGNRTAPSPAGTKHCVGVAATTHAAGPPYEPVHQARTAVDSDDRL
ncbi:hypothetical protein B0H67DRAFT_681960 [Lasiosphaeris hirsuta]|uniref:Uncharacterized protein n=1 Tax=Lasiosphaeris hirsuta TaxID=260670 RepID=A0AA40E033_9PEZI|nr:hypothetical protein B0H67DRAFT_681960 [Lasiosphaeris hirsuta]